MQSGQANIAQGGSSMKANPLDGKLARSSISLKDRKLIKAYYLDVPDPLVAAQQVSFGAAGHRGSVLEKAFNEWHILAICQAICQYRKKMKIDGPLFLGMDNHVLAVPTLASTVEVLAANHVEVLIGRGEINTPVLEVSRAILTYNFGRKKRLADGMVITPSNYPSHFGGIAYNPSHGGCAEAAVALWIEAKANGFLKNQLRRVKKIPFSKAIRSASTHFYEYRNHEIADMALMTNVEEIRAARDLRRSSQLQRIQDEAQAIIDGVLNASLN
jgi:phosphoglucomutase